jgi:hypothetical protein
MHYGYLLCIESQARGLHTTYHLSLAAALEHLDTYCNTYVALPDSIIIKKLK